MFSSLGTEYQGQRNNSDNYNINQDDVYVAVIMQEFTGFF